MKPANLFADIPAELPEELTQRLLETKGVRIERIVSRGHASPAGFWYEQAEDEWVILLSGAASVRFDGESACRGLNAGDYLFIPAGVRHRVESTAADTDTIWLAIFFR